MMAEDSFVKKVRMGKRIEKAFARDKAQSSATADSHDDDPNRTPEPYGCTGHFQNDFTELCRRNQMSVIPPVILRPHRPPSPAPIPVAEEKTKPGKKDDKKNQPPPEPEPEPLVDENGEPQEPPPKTYSTKDKFEYFKPTVQVEMLNPDKLDIVTEIFIRGWKIDEPMMTVFKQCFPKMDHLHSINLWNTGLNDETLEILGQCLPDCGNLRNLTVENNPVKSEAWHLLIKEESPVQNLSLRYNGITDKGAELLGKALGTTTVQNQKLISINLNGNHVTDQGAEALANGLRMNRTLLSLGLAHNKIGDMGAHKLAEVLSRFPLTHEEVVERRKLLSSAPDRKSVSKQSRHRRRKKLEHGLSQTSPTQSTSESPLVRESPTKGKTQTDPLPKTPKTPGMLSRSSSSEAFDLGDDNPPPGGKRSDSRDRPGSVRSSHGQVTAKGKSAKAKKDPKGKEEEKHDKTAGKSKKQDDKPQKKGGGSSSGRGSGASVVADTKGGAKKGHDKGKGKKGAQQAEQESADQSEVLNPLLDMMEPLKDGVLLLKGNMNLISLNLSHNEVSEEGVKSLLAAIRYQTTIIELKGNKPGNTGLMRLCLQRNKISKTSEDLQKLTELMHTKDPFYKPPAKSPDQESQH